MFIGNYFSFACDRELETVFSRGVEFRMIDVTYRTITTSGDGDKFSPEKVVGRSGERISRI